MRSPPPHPGEASVGGARFSGAIEYRFLRGPFFADLTVTDDGLELGPRFVRTFRKTFTLKSDVLRVTVGGIRSRGVRFESRGGSLDRFIFVPFSPRERHRLREELKSRGYPLAD